MATFFCPLKMAFVERFDYIFLPGNKALFLECKYSCNLILDA